MLFSTMFCSPIKSLCRRNI